MAKALDPLKKFRLVHSFIRRFLWIRNFPARCLYKADLPINQGPFCSGSRALRITNLWLLDSLLLFHSLISRHRLRGPPICTFAQTDERVRGSRQLSASDCASGDDVIRLLQVLVKRVP